MKSLAAIMIGLLGSIFLATGLEASENGVRVDTSKIGVAEKIYVYEGGSIALERSIEPDSAEAREIAAWLRSHEDGWDRSLRTSFTSYAPHKLIRGERFSLNFSDDGRSCIFNYREGDGKNARHGQVSREFAKDDPIPRVFHAVP